MANTSNHKPNNGSFQKGEDNRRNTSGQRNKASVAFSRTLRELIVTEGEASLKLDGKRYKKIELLIRKVWNEALSGKEWAVQFIAERVEGKVKTEIGIDANMKLEGNVIRVRDIASEQKP